MSTASQLLQEVKNRENIHTKIKCFIHLLFSYIYILLRLKTEHLKTQKQHVETDNQDHALPLLLKPGKCHSCKSRKVKEDSPIGFNQVAFVVS